MIDSAQLIKIIHQLPASLISIIVTNVLLILGFALGKLVLYRNENAIKFYAYFSTVPLMKRSIFIQTFRF